jgi:hypothetical protein
MIKACLSNSMVYEPMILQNAPYFIRAFGRLVGYSKQKTEPAQNKGLLEFIFHKCGHSHQYPICIPVLPHEVLSQNTELFITTAVRNLNPFIFYFCEYSNCSLLACLGFRMCPWLITQFKPC